MSESDSAAAREVCRGIAEMLQMLAQAGNAIAARCVVDVYLADAGELCGARIALGDKTEIEQLLQRRTARAL